MNKIENIRYNACSIQKGQNLYSVIGVDETNSGYIISYSPKSNSESLVVYDQGDEIEYIVSSCGEKDSLNSHDLEIDDFHVKTNIYQNLSSERQKKVLEIIEKTLWSDHYTMTNYLVSRAGKIANFNPAEARPIKYCAKIEQPILIVHGNKDKRINIGYARDNFLKTSSLKKEFIEVGNANHLNVWKIGGERYFEQVIAFVEKNTSDKTFKQ